MASFSFGGLEQALADTRGSGVSFESQAKKWETEDQGAFDFSEHLFRCFRFSFIPKFILLIF